jgi:hypothetical protein
MMAETVWRMLYTRDINARRVMRPISRPAPKSTPMAPAKPNQKRFSKGANKRLSLPISSL